MLLTSAFFLKLSLLFLRVPLYLFQQLGLAVAFSAFISPIPAFFYRELRSIRNDRAANTSICLLESKKMFLHVLVQDFLDLRTTDGKNISGDI
jgi:hypothetical protein